MKGGAFENEVCKLLSLWWTGGKRDDAFCRSRSSGAWFTSRKKSGKTTENQAGDIMANTNEGKKFMDVFHIECKTGYGRKNKAEMVRWDLLDLLDSVQKEPVFLKMWNQATNEASITMREPILIFRRNRRTPCIAFRGHIYDEYNEVVEGGISGLYNLLHLKIGSLMYGDMIIMSLDNFFNWLDTKGKRDIFLKGIYNK